MLRARFVYELFILVKVSWAVHVNLNSSKKSTGCALEVISTMYSTHNYYDNFLTVIYVPEMFCPEPWPVVNSSRSNSSRKIGSLMWYSCDKYHSFLDGSTNLSVTCLIEHPQSTETVWSNKPECLCKFEIILKVQYYFEYR